MGDQTKIQWTDASWPIVNGCRRVSPGCERCYAERLSATRLKHQPKYAGLATMTPDGPRWTGEARLWEAHLEWPLQWKRPRRIFVADMGDLFYDGVSDDDVARVFAVMALAERHTFQVLTKRPDRMRDLLTSYPGQDHPGELSFWARVGALCEDYAVRVERQSAGAMMGFDAWWQGIAEQRYLPNVWLGVSAEDQATADARIPVLQTIPAAVRFVSAEPLLGAIDLSLALRTAYQCGHCGDGSAIEEGPCRACGPDADGVHEGYWLEYPALDWVIAGGESGPGARPCELEWVQQLVNDCAAADVACFVKQLGARPLVPYYADANGCHDWQDWALEAHTDRQPLGRWQRHGRHLVPVSEGFQPPPDALLEPCLESRKGDEPAEWPASLRVRQWPDESGDRRE